MSAHPQPSSSGPVWVAIILIVAVLTGAGAAVLFHMVGAGPPATVTAAGAAFVSTATLGLAIASFLGGR